jgi:hypothetical protein
MMTSDNLRSAPERHIVKTTRLLTVQRVLCITQVLGFHADVVHKPLGVFFVTPAPLTQPERAGLLWYFFHLNPKELRDVVRLHPTLERIVRWHATYRCGQALVKQLDRLRPPLVGLARKRLVQFLEAESEERAEWVGRHYARDLLRADQGMILHLIAEEHENEAEFAHMQARIALWCRLMAEATARLADRRKPLLILDAADERSQDVPVAAAAWEAYWKQHFHS